MTPEAPIFTAEYERELETWLRRRLGWLLGVTLVLSAFGLVFAALQVMLLRLEPGDSILRDPTMAAMYRAGWIGPTIMILSAVITVALAAWFLWRVRPALHSRQELVRAAGRFVLLNGLATVAMDVATRIWMPGVATSGFGTLTILYFFACVFLPWSGRESLRPMWPLLGLYAASQFMYVAIGADGDAAVQVGIDEGEMPTMAVRLIAAGAASLSAPLALLPGLLVCWVRLWMHRRRFRRRMVHTSFFSMRRELSQARAVLGALFPAEVRMPGVAFGFHHVPADEVGGDYLHASTAPGGSLRVVLVDVSGHGLAAAMTVARLSGEIDRIVAACPEVGPGELLRQLNAYCLLTLTRQGIHATAAALQLDPATGVTRYASAGHPPVFVRGADRRVQRHDSTTLLLGAMGDDGFDSVEQSIALSPGDTLFMVTDGLFEARNRVGEQFGLDRLETCVARVQPPDDWNRHLIDLVQSWRNRMADDDLLVATIRWNGMPDGPTAQRGMERPIAVGASA
jgi:hypothetical protein